MYICRSFAAVTCVYMRYFVILEKFYEYLQHEQTWTSKKRKVRKTKKKERKCTKQITERNNRIIISILQLDVRTLHKNWKLKITLHFLLLFLIIFT